MALAGDVAKSALPIFGEAGFRVERFDGGECLRPLALLELALRGLERSAAARSGAEQQPAAHAGGCQQHKQQREGGKYQKNDHRHGSL